MNFSIEEKPIPVSQVEALIDVTKRVVVLSAAEGKALYLGVTGSQLPTVSDLTISDIKELGSYRTFHGTITITIP